MAKRINPMTKDELDAENKYLLRKLATATSQVERLRYEFQNLAHVDIMRLTAGRLAYTLAAIEVAAQVAGNIKRRALYREMMKPDDEP